MTYWDSIKAFYKKAYNFVYQNWGRDAAIGTFVLFTLAFPIIHLIIIGIVGIVHLIRRTK